MSKKDPEFTRLKEYDFADAKPVSAFPHLAKRRRVNGRLEVGRKRRKRIQDRASEMKKMNPKVECVRPLSGYKLDLTFGNGQRRLFDVSPYLGMPVFKQLKDPSRFQSARVVAGSVEWAGEVALSYDTLYLESEPTPIPRKAAA